MNSVTYAASDKCEMNAKTPSPAPPTTPREVRIVTGMDGVTREITYDDEGCVESRRVVEALGERLVTEAT